MDHLRDNLVALAHRDLALARRVGALDPARVPPVELARSGAPTIALAPRTGGPPVLLHSRYDPALEARRFLEAIAVGPTDTVILLGFGLGHHLRALTARLSTANRVFVVERDIALFRAALAASDFTDLLDERVRFFVELDDLDLYAGLRSELRRIFASRVVLVAPSPLAAADPEGYRRTLPELRKFVGAAQIVLQTAFVLPRLNLESQTASLVEWLRGRSVSDYRGRFEGRPAVVVAAGPSLGRNVEGLRAARGRAVLIAVSTALKPLLARGLTPDFACVLDYHRLSRRYFDGIPAAGAPPLFCDPKANAEAVAAYSGPKVFPDDDLLGYLSGGVCGERGRVEGGGTVAHTAFFLACYLGCDPVIFVGLDLSYTGGLVHIPGTAIHAQRRGELNRFHTLDTREWEFFARQRRYLTEVPGQTEPTVHTDDLMLSYLRDFELLFRQAGVRVVDATEGGARKAGCESLTLAEAIRRYCGERLPPEAFEPPRAPDVEGRLRATDLALARCREEGETLQGHLRSAIRLLKRVVQRNRKGRPADAWVAEVQRLHARMMEARLERLRRLVEGMAYADGFERSRRDLRIDLGEAQGVARQRLQAERDRAYLQGVERGLEFLLGRVDLARERVRSALEDRASPARAGPALGVRP
ncbi:MAG: motility associated factor glycosyltransferase family protein [Planctomycetes bacterium]|nr:motility associated factor glycosyltransferase family protein [Planctomycetota bacterium]